MRAQHGCLIALVILAVLWIGVYYGLSKLWPILEGLPR